MAVSNSDTVILPDAAICLSDFQNASSRLTLVLCPPRTTDRFTIRDFIFGLVLNSGFIPVVDMAGKETGSTDDARSGILGTGATAHAFRLPVPVPAGLRRRGELEELGRCASRHRLVQGRDEGGER